MRVSDVMSSASAGSLPIQSYHSGSTDDELMPVNRLDLVERFCTGKNQLRIFLEGSVAIYANR